MEKHKVKDGLNGILKLEFKQQKVQRTLEKIEELFEQSIHCSQPLLQIYKSVFCKLITAQ